MQDRWRAWIEAETGARVVRMERAGSGASRATFLVELAGGSGPSELVLRADSGDGPMAGTELSLAREAAVYRALAGSGVAIPRLVAAREDALLVERAHGSDSLDGLAASERAALMDGYVDALAVLHRLDAARLALPGFHRPTSGRSHAEGELALWRGILDGRVERPAPLAHRVHGWLVRHAPEKVERTALCHGDVGPGNFLHASGRVTALLDWEFAHLGDPMDDLGWLAFRGHHMNADVGDLAAQLCRWSEATGLPLDSRRIAYYRAFVMWRWLVSCLAALDSGAASLDRSVYFSLIPLLEALLPRALAELADVTLDAPPAPPAEVQHEDAHVIASLLADVGGVILPAATGEAARRARGAALLLVHLQAAAKHGDAVRAAERADRAELESAAADDDARWIRAAARLGARRLALWPYIAPLALRPLARIEQ